MVFVQGRSTLFTKLFLGTNFFVYREFLYMTLIDLVIVLFLVEKIVKFRFQFKTSEVAFPVYRNPVKAGFLKCCIEIRS